MPNKPTAHVTGCRCCDCEWTSTDDMLPEECPSCGGEDVMHSMSDDHLWEEADRQIDEAKEDV